MQFIAFPMGAFWLLSPSGVVTGLVLVRDFERTDGIQGRFEALVQATTGQTLRLEPISVRHHRNSLFSFSGRAIDVDAWRANGVGLDVLTDMAGEFEQTLRLKHGLDDAEVHEALKAAGIGD